MNAGQGKQWALSRNADLGKEYKGWACMGEGHMQNTGTYAAVGWVARHRRRVQTSCSPKRENRGLLLPTTAATTGPAAQRSKACETMR